MNTCYIEHELAYRREILLRVADAERNIQQLQRGRESKSEGKYFWYEVLALPIPFYDGLHANVAQSLAYDAFRRRTQSLIVLVGSAAFGLGMLIGGWLHPLFVLLLGCIATLVACVPVARRAVALLRRRGIKPALH